MKTEQLNYYLPPELIAQKPCAVRDESKLLVFNREDGSITDSRFSKIAEYLRPGDCLVLNDTKVLAARFFAARKSGASLEGLFITENVDRIWKVLMKGLGKVKTGEQIILKDKFKNDYCHAFLLEKLPDGHCLLKIDSPLKIEDVLEKIGFPPLPPYIKRDNNPDQAEIDKTRYQTIYAQKNGAVAAPTAGLHFTDQLLNQLKNKGVNTAYVTLHVGEGTFLPVTADDLNKHKMHKELFVIDEKTAELINQTKSKGGRIIAVGTTSVRTLESAADNGKVKAMSGWTDLFIMPGFKFQIVDCMITNFHLPKSTLLALVGAFAGLDNIMRAYQHAVEHKYRFYSYGDAMLIL